MPSSYVQSFRFHTVVVLRTQVAGPQHLPATEAPARDTSWLKQHLLIPLYPPFTQKLHRTDLQESSILLLEHSCQQQQSLSVAHSLATHFTANQVAKKNYRHSIKISNLLGPPLGLNIYESISAFCCPVHPLTLITLYYIGNWHITNPLAIIHPLTTIASDSQRAEEEELIPCNATVVPEW